LLLEYVANYANGFVLKLSTFCYSHKDYWTIY